MKIGLFFGSRSVEHEISIITAMQVVNAVDRTKHEVIPIYISKSGEWFTGSYLLDISNFKDLTKIPQKTSKIINLKLNNKNKLILETKGNFLTTHRIEIDIAFPVIHGTFGEDGKIQGLFEILNVPYVGAGVTASAIGMDKVLMKDVFKSNNLPIVNYTWIKRKEWETDPDACISKIETALKYPLFVKPANLGSSIGINKAKSKEELREAIEIAKFYDRRIIIEESVENAREINCAVLGNDEPIVSDCEEVTTWKAFLDYDAKYISWQKSNTSPKMGGHIIPASLPDALTKSIQTLAVEAFKAIDCRGIARVDFLLDPSTNRVYINEINTMPGALSYYLWSASGISFTKLIDNLINLALESFEDGARNITSIDTKVLLQNLGIGRAGKTL
jgi:D-alanine-D-alanine ligase